jgi:nucleotide-binding universal stress UspA family protein
MKSGTRNTRRTTNRGKRNRGDPSGLLSLETDRARSLSKSLKLQHILVPIDFSPNSRQALDFAVPLAEMFDARLTLLHVVELTVYPQDMGPVPTDTLRLSQAALEHLDTFAAETVPAGLPENRIVRKGLPYREIADAAHELEADLIVLTTHGYTGLTHVLLGSTAERVVRHAPCPVLTVRSCREKR